MIDIIEKPKLEQIIKEEMDEDNKKMREVRKGMLDSMKKDEAESKKWSIKNWLRGSN